MHDYSTVELIPKNPAPATTYVPDYQLRNSNIQRADKNENQYRRSPKWTFISC